MHGIVINKYITQLLQWICFIILGDHFRNPGVRCLTTLYALQNGFCINDVWLACHIMSRSCCCLGKSVRFSQTSVNGLKACISSMCFEQHVGGGGTWRKLGLWLDQPLLSTQGRCAAHMQNTASMLSVRRVCFCRDECLNLR